MQADQDGTGPAQALDAPAADPAVSAARLAAKERIAAEVAARAGQDRMKARRAKIGKYLVGGMFVVMLFERAVNGGWFN